MAVVTPVVNGGTLQRPACAAVLLVCLLRQQAAEERERDNGETGGPSAGEVAGKKNIFEGQLFSRPPAVPSLFRRRKSAASFSGRLCAASCWRRQRSRTINNQHHTERAAGLFELHTGEPKREGRESKEIMKAPPTHIYGCVVGRVVGISRRLTVENVSTQQASLVRESRLSAVATAAAVLDAFRQT